MKIFDKYKIVTSAFDDLPLQTYDREVEDYFQKSPELLDTLEQQKQQYQRLGGVEKCISVGNSLYFCYREHEAKKHIYVIGIISRQKGKIGLGDLIGLFHGSRKLLEEFKEKLQTGWVMFASVNSNSRRIVNKLKKISASEGVPLYEHDYGKHAFIEDPEYTFHTIALSNSPTKPPFVG